MRRYDGSRQPRLDPNATCTWNGGEVQLTVTEFLLLKSLAQRPGHVKTRDQLMDAAYGESIYVDDRTIDSHIKRLRAKFRQTDSARANRDTLRSRLLISRPVTEKTPRDSEDSQPAIAKAANIAVNAAHSGDQCRGIAVPIAGLLTPALPMD